MSVLVKRVVVGVDGSPGSLAALERAAHEAIRHHAQLCPVLAWDLSGGEALHSSQPTLFPAFLEVPRRAEREAEKRLAEACDAVLARIPDEVNVCPQVLRADPGPVLVACSRHSTDLLVLGVGDHGLLHRLRRRSARRHCLRHARCPVLVVAGRGHGCRASGSEGGCRASGSESGCRASGAGSGRGDRGLTPPGGDRATALSSARELPIPMRLR
ncbi:universal stress protein [Kitasatospora sp. NPDC089797]|uniref:universal stress protein n=1 Tax=Kitasatospora sp. NPDC089797 TaxID=3155298 RepID=UPI00341FFC53